MPTYEIVALTADKLQFRVLPGCFGWFLACVFVCVPAWFHSEDQYTLHRDGTLEKIAQPSIDCCGCRKPHGPVFYRHVARAQLQTLQGTWGPQHRVLLALKNRTFVTLSLMYQGFGHDEMNALVNEINSFLGVAQL